MAIQLFLGYQGEKDRQNNVCLDLSQFVDQSSLIVLGRYLDYYDILLPLQLTHVHYKSSLFELLGLTADR